MGAALAAASGDWARASHFSHYFSYAGPNSRKNDYGQSISAKSDAWIDDIYLIQSVPVCRANRGIGLPRLSA